MSAEACYETESQFYFLVIPGEGGHLSEARWDKVLCNLQSSGRTILGTGPDLDWPIRYELVDESDPFGAFYEVFDTIPLPEYRDMLAESEIL